MAAPELRPLRIGEVLDAAFKVYRRNALTMWKIITLVVVPVNLLGALVLVSVLPGDFFDPDFGVDPTTGGIESDEVWAVVAAFLVVGLITAITVVAATAACLKVVSDSYMGKKSDAGSSLAFAGRRLHSLVWVAFLTVFYIFLIALVAVFSAFIAGPLAILFAVPIIWLWISWSFAPPAFLVEGVKGRAALGRSFDLVKGRWWQVFWTIVLSTIITSIAGFGIGLVLGPLTGETSSLTAAVLVDAVVRSITAILTTPFSAAVIGILYFDLRVRKEGLDLQLLAERIGSPMTATGPLPPEAGPQP